ncbi:hypothetical protein JHK87_049565 [Glycine soja]|nr:hypothetical protein JHK87_049565 [Glycine soja]
MAPDIQHLEKLQVLDVDNLPDEFEECIAPNGGLEHPSIQHVPLDVKAREKRVEQLLESNSHISKNI